MIKKVFRAKGRVVVKPSARGDNIFYVETIVNDKLKCVLIKDIHAVVEKYQLSPAYLPYVYGEMIYYTKLEKGVQDKKFRIKGIDKHYKPK